MGVVEILLLTAIAALLGRVRRARSLALLIASILVIYWLQPPGAHWDFWLPTLSLALTLLAWTVTAPPEMRGRPENLLTLLLVLGTLGAILLSARLLPQENPFTSPISLRRFLPTLSLFLVLLIGFSLRKNTPPLLLPGLTLLLLAIFAVLKSPLLTARLTTLLGLPLPTNPDGTPAALPWLGYSYLAFRLIHTLRDRQSGVLPPVTLSEYLTYALFFPSFTAGPIDRLERFLRELRNPLPMRQADWLFVIQRLARGLFKKFVLADLLALISINERFVFQALSPFWLWLALAFYALRLYFDFSGYTDIAIGLGRLLGIRLPENFHAPFLQPNLTQFWNAWHITLTQWFRAYYFNPLTRSLRARNALPATIILLIGQGTTMLLIGLWHGFTWNFALWGAWHGLGLFLQNRWSQVMRPRLSHLETQPVARAGLRTIGIVLTFLYFSLSMAFFALPAPDLSLSVFLRLLGIV